MRGVNNKGVGNNIQPLFILSLIIIGFSIFLQSSFEITGYNVYEEDTGDQMVNGSENSSLIIPLLILVIIASLVFGITRFRKR